jgi:hypothetical protein
VQLAKQLQLRQFAVVRTVRRPLRSRRRNLVRIRGVGWSPYKYRFLGKEGKKKRRDIGTCYDEEKPKTHQEQEQPMSHPDRLLQWEREVSTAFPH